jgi:hypothetical protein
MVSALKSVENVTLSILDHKDLQYDIFEYPKVNAYIEERVKNLHSSISSLQEYNPKEKKWEIHHIVSNPVIGKKILEHFKFGTGEDFRFFDDVKTKAVFTEAVGVGSILTANTKDSHSKIHKDYLTYFSTIYKNEDFILRLQRNVANYLMRYTNKETHICLNELVGELITVVIQNTVNGYSYDVLGLSQCIGKILAPENEQLKSADEIGKLKGEKSWFSGPISVVSSLVIPFFKNIMIDRPANNIYAEGVSREDSFPKCLKDRNYREEHIKANIKTGFFAQETMRNLLFFLLYEYAQDLSVQESERQSVLDFDHQLSHTLLPKEIKQRVLMGLHEYPTGGSTRRASFPLKISWTEEGEAQERYVKAGEFITYSPYAASHHPIPWQEYCKDEKSEEFDVQKLEKLAHLPFGSGQHLCPAHKFVVPVMSILLCVFLDNYRIQLADHLQSCRPVMSGTLQADRNVLVVLTPKEGFIED